MFAAGGFLKVKQSLASVTRKDPVIYVRVKFTSGRMVYTDRGAFHYSELEIPEKAPTFVPKLPVLPSALTVRRVA
jgi:hypothetical protein